MGFAHGLKTSQSVATPDGRMSKCSLCGQPTNGFKLRPVDGTTRLADGLCTLPPRGFTLRLGMLP